nr:heat shock protein 90-6, mitochondrial [Tanacetum cinerariifolium]
MVKLAKILSILPEGEVEYRSILYVLAVTPIGKQDIVKPKTKNIRLYVKRVFNSDDIDGKLVRTIISSVVDSNDLPLNVSREILQESRVFSYTKGTNNEETISKEGIRLILGISMSEKREDYEIFWENFRKHLKLGCGNG